MYKRRVIHTPPREEPGMHWLTASSWKLKRCMWDVKYLTDVCVFGKWMTGNECAATTATVWHDVTTALITGQNKSNTSGSEYWFEYVILKFPWSTLESFLSHRATIKPSIYLIDCITTRLWISLSHSSILLVSSLQRGDMCSDRCSDRCVHYQMEAVLRVLVCPRALSVAQRGLWGASRTPSIHFSYAGFKISSRKVWGWTSARRACLACRLVVWG